MTSSYLGISRVVYLSTSWSRVSWILTTIVAVIGLVFVSVAPADASGSKTISAGGSGVVLHEPTAAQKAEAMRRLDQAQKADPEGFDERLRLIKNSKELMTYLSSDSRFDAGLQQKFLAASMPTEVLQSLVSLTETGYLTLEVKDGPNNTKVAKFSKAEPTLVGGGKGSMAMKPMFPQCPSAWAAMWAWWGTNAAFCGAMGFFGPGAAIACSGFMMLAGSAIDFNKGC